MESITELLQELGAVRAQVQQLEAKVAQKQSDLGEATGLSRRHLLRAAPAAALGGVAAMMLGSAAPGAAASGDPVLLGQSNDEGLGQTSIQGGTTDQFGQALSVVGGVYSDQLTIGNGTGPYPTWPIPDHIPDYGPKFGLVSSLIIAPDNLTLDTQDGNGVGPGNNVPAAAIYAPVVYGGHAVTGRPGLLVQSSGPEATIDAVSLDGSAYVGTPATSGHEIPVGGIAVRAQASAGGAIDASSDSGVGVAVKVNTNHALTVESTSSTTNVDAVTIDYQGTSRALYATSHNPTNINGTVTGVNEGHGIGVWGEQRNDSVSGYGVIGVAGKLGRGAQFSGGAAQVRLVPGVAAIHPPTGKAGDVYVDSTARIWFCVLGTATGVTAHWRQLAFA